MTEGGRHHALVARVSLAFALLMSAGVFLAAGPWTPTSGTALAVGSLTLMVAGWASRIPVVLQALALAGAGGVTLPRERMCAAREIRRPEEPGRPGRPRPRAPGGLPRPRPAH